MTRYELAVKKESERCTGCNHGKQDHPSGMFGCVAAIGIVRCPCWTYSPVGVAEGQEAQ